MNHSPFVYLLNAMEEAAREKNPYKAGYAQRRAEVLRYVAELEAKLAPPSTGTAGKGE